jgi:hypothetical protein
MQFVDGPMGTPDDERRGCVSFGQTRRYSLRTTGLVRAAPCHCHTRLPS